MKQNLWLTLVTCLAYCVDKELWRAIDYLKEQVRVLKEQQEKDKRILLDDHQRIKLAAKAKRLTRKLLEETTVLFTPDTILAWYRSLTCKDSFLAGRKYLIHDRDPLYADKFDSILKATGTDPVKAS
jgi:hypothetical protein